MRSRQNGLSISFISPASPHTSAKRRLITPTQELLPDWTIPEWPDLSDVTLPEALTLVYHLPVELHTMASQLKAYLALQGCELTVIFHDAKTWDGCLELADADIMMGDRLIGEAPEYTLEQWLRCDASGRTFLALRLTLICKPRWMRYRLRPRLGIDTRGCKPSSTG